MNKIERFWNYLGCSDKTLNERQLLRLICLLGKEPDLYIKPLNNELSLMEEIVDIYIKAFETNSFKAIKEEDVLFSLAEIS